MTVAKGRPPKTAFDLVVQYTAAGEDHQAARVYSESSLSFKRYLEARNRGKKAQSQ